MDMDVKPSLSSAALVPKSFKTLTTRFMSRSFNYAPILTDEIALEGLDGITLQALWLRLEHRRGFNLSINGISKSMFWESLRRNRFVEFYELPVERPDLVLYDRNEYVDDRGNTFEPLSVPEDIYLYAPVDDVAKGVRGSCPYYGERRDIGQFARKLKLEDVVAIYGNKLVIVAHQDVRDKILFSNSFMEPSELSIMQYCILERVGRARYHGESTRGKISLSVTKVDAKTLFYHRKILISKQLVNKQAFSMKFGPNRLSSLITLFHLPRFFVLYKSNQVRNVERLFQELQGSPDFRKELSVLKHQYGKSLMKTITEDYSDVFECQDEALGILHPERVLELKDRTKVEGFSKRPLKVVRLKNPDMNFTTYLAQKVASKDDEEDTEAAEKDISVFDEIRCQTSVLINCWKYFIQNYADGCTLADIMDKFNMFGLDARSVARLASKLNLVVSFVEDGKKTKFQRFVYYKCSEANQIVRHLTSSLPSEKVVGSSSTNFYRALDRIRFDAADLQQDSSMMVPIVELGDQNLQTICPSESEPNEILSLEDNITNPIQLPHQSAQQVEENLILVSQESGTQSKAQSTIGEKLVFIPVKFIDAHDEQGVLVSRCPVSAFTYPGLFGWEVTVELAEVNPKVIKDASFLVNSIKTVRRVKYILKQVTTNKFIASSSRILQGLRTYEAEVDGNSYAKMDRFSLFRILKELHKDKKIQIWKITLGFEHFHRTVVGFTPGDTLMNSPSLHEGINCLIRWLHFKFVRPKQKAKKDALHIRTKRKPVKRRYIKKANDEGGNMPLVEAVRKTKRARSKLVQEGGILHAKRYIYDDEDLAARHRLKRQRASWTPVEDAAMLYAFIASVLFLPRYRLERLIMYNSAQIRDVLHRRVKEARTKTTTAIRRRFHFLMRRPEIHSRLRQNLASAVRDKDLKMYIKDKYEPASMSLANQSFARVSVEGLSEVFDYLKEKFEFGTVRRPNPILSHADTIPESRKRKLASLQAEDSKRSKYLPREEDVDVDPLDIGEFDSGNYSDYTPLGFATTLTEKSARIFESHSDADNVAELRLVAAKATLFSLLFSGHPSEVVTSVVEKIDDTALVNTLNYLREQTVITVTKTLRFTLALPMKRKLQNFFTPPMYNYAASVLQGLRHTSVFNCTKVSTLSSLYALIEVCALPSNLGDILIDMPRNVVDFNQEWKSLLKTPGSTQSPVGQKELRESERLSTSTALDDPDVSEDNMDDSNIYELNLRDFKSRFIKTLGLPTDQLGAPNIFNLTLPHIHVNLTGLAPPLDADTELPSDFVGVMRNHLLETIPSANEVTNINIPPEFLSIARSIYSAGENGVSLLSLKKFFDSNLITKAVNYLISKKIVFVVGNAFCKLIGLPFVKVWSNIPINTGRLHYSSRRFIARPWINGAGEINWQLVDQLLCSLIGSAELNPGASVRQIASSLTPVISTVEGVILLKLLNRLKLVKVFHCIGSEPPKSMFEKQKIHSIVDEDKGWSSLEFETLFTEVVDLYTLKYSDVRQRLEQELGRNAFAVKASTSFTAIDPRRRNVSVAAALTPKKEEREIQQF